MDAREITAVHYRPSPPLEANFNHDCWHQACPLPLDFNWQGAPAPPELRTAARVIWTRDELWIGFECSYTELDIDEEFDPRKERYALWERDVCEAFIRSPLELSERVYKEFEVAPTGQWCDLLVDRLHMQHDWEWQSGMRTACQIDQAEHVWRVVMALPFAAFGCRPEKGDCWQGNLFRISRLNGERHYLALAPTLTERPNFHVPERFVALKFIG
jgi:hypothetical protein